MQTLLLDEKFDIGSRNLLLVCFDGGDLFPKAMQVYFDPANKRNR
jgi:hypothetical protein